MADFASKGVAGSGLGLGKMFLGVSDEYSSLLGW